MDTNLAMHTQDVFLFSMGIFQYALEKKETGAQMWERIEAIADGRETMVSSAAELPHYSEAAHISAQKHQNDKVKRDREIAAMLVAARDGFPKK